MQAQDSYFRPSSYISAQSWLWPSHQMASSLHLVQTIEIELSGSGIQAQDSYCRPSRNMLVKSWLWPSHQIASGWHLVQMIELSGSGTQAREGHSSSFIT